MTASTRTRKSSRRSADKREAAIARQRELMAALEQWQEEHDEDEIIDAKIAIWAERYSERNASLIVMQAPDATELRGYRDWQAQGRQVRKGESGIMILAPAGQAGGTDATEATADAPAEPGKPGKRFFRLIPVFDLAQTDEIVPVEKGEPREKSIDELIAEEVALGDEM
jgi:hypothetical protein